jgi:hypothetical protein
MNTTARALVALALAGCSRESGPRESMAPIAMAPAASSAPTASGAPAASGTPTAPSGPAASSPGANAAPAAGADSPPPPHVVKTKLVTSPVQIELPSGWDLVANQSDEGTGLVAFAPGANSKERGATAFLDGSLVARFPRSMLDAQNQAVDRDECRGPDGCAVLGKDAADGLFVVTVREPRALVVTAWRRLTSDQAVRCGFEMTGLPATGRSKTVGVADETPAVARARAEGEAICRSVKAAR